MFAYWCLLSYCFNAHPFPGLAALVDVDGEAPVPGAPPGHDGLKTGRAAAEWQNTMLLGTGPYAKKLVRRAFEGEDKKFKAQAGGNDAIAEIEMTLGQISHPAPRSGLTTFPKGFRSWPKMTGKQNFDLISYLPIAMALSPKADRWAALRSAVAEIAYMHVQVNKLYIDTWNSMVM